MALRDFYKDTEFLAGDIGETADPKFEDLLEDGRATSRRAAKAVEGTIRICQNEGVPRE